MATATNRTGPLRFRGLPDAVEAFVPLALGEASFALEVDLPDPEAVAVLLAPSGPGTLVRLTLPTTTPAGMYEGTLTAGEERYPAVVEVEPNRAVELYPAQLRLRVAPGGRATERLTLVNEGNVAVEVPRADAVGLFPVDGADRAIGGALRDDKAKGSARLDRLMDGLAGEHGGLLRIGVDQGAGPVEPGGVAEIALTLSASDRLQPGRTYTAIWHLAGWTYAITVEAEPAPPKEQPR
ncbi:MAG TPA: hypothetical protein VM324_00835 [Egibacteraceae bacterium]|jgi:hypothetical protein|nr:hypothetical protein [Egibacteraceae bacterium]